MSILKKLGRNIKSLGINTVIKVVVMLFLTPFIIHKVGKEPYGIYLLALTFTGYFGVLDFGMLSALVKFVAEFKGANNKEGINQAINVSFSFYFCIGLIVTIILVVASFFIGKLFRLAPHDVITMRNLLLIAAAFSIFSWVGNVFRGVIRGFQMYHWEVSVNITTLLINAGLVFILLSNGYGLVALMLVSQGVNFVSSLIFYLITRHEIGKMKLTFLYTSNPVFKKMFGFSFYLFLASLFDILVFQLDYIIIGFFLGAGAITIYSIAFSIQQQIRSISPILLEPTWPLTAELEGAKQYDKQRDLLLTGTRLSTLVFIPMILITLLFAKPFITNWMGPGFEESVLPAQVLLFFWFFNAHNNLGSMILTAKGLVKKIFWIGAISGIFNLVVSIILVNIIGILGIAIAKTIAMVLIAFPLIFRIIRHELNIPFSEFYRVTVAPNLPVYFVVALLSYGALSLYYPGRFVLVLAEMGVIYGLSMGFAYLFVLKPEEKNQLRKLIYR
jgi:O-antigen/teichoic acid export membrane protein